MILRKRERERERERERKREYKKGVLTKVTAVTKQRSRGYTISSVNAEESIDKFEYNSKSLRD